MFESYSFCETSANLLSRSWASSSAKFSPGQSRGQSGYVICGSPRAQMDSNGIFGCVWSGSVMVIINLSESKAWRSHLAQGPDISCRRAPFNHGVSTGPNSNARLLNGGMAEVGWLDVS